MGNKKSLLGSGWGMVGRNKRYIFWFWLLNLTLAWFGTLAFSKIAHAMLDHSLAADGLLHRFDLAVIGEWSMRPEFGPVSASALPARCFAVLFFLATALFLPGVFQGYASSYRLPREDFFRACGRNLWRLIRLMIVAGVVMGIFAGALFAINGKIVEKAGESANEVLPFEIQMVGLAVIFLVMTMLRIWFDLAQVDVVLSDQRAVRKSIAGAFRHAFRGLGRLLASYVATTIVAAIILLSGIWIWMKFVAPEKWFGAFLLSQLVLFLLLVPRFWQRGVAVSYWKLNMMVVPAVAVQPITQLPIAESVPVAARPDPAPVTDPPSAGEGI
jgi:hypothetical protein